MRLKSLIGIILWGGMLVACGPDNRVALAEKLGYHLDHGYTAYEVWDL